MTKRPIRPGPMFESNVAPSLLHPSDRRIAGPDQLIQAVPYLLGFHPRRSLVLVGLAAGMLVVTARCDLGSDTGATADPLGPLTARMHAGGATDVVAVVFADDGADPAVDAALDGVCAAVDGRPLRLTEALLVVGDRWWSMSCTAPDCCPAEGRQLPASPSTFTAAATLDGVVPLRDRDALALTLAPAAGRDALREALTSAEHGAEGSAGSAGSTGSAGSAGATQQRSAKRAIFAAARASAAARWAGPSDADACRFAVALRALPVRDALWLAVDERRIDGRVLWRDLARRMPSPYDAAPLFLYGWSSWRHGDGALARIAAERAVSADAAYSAADLLLGALNRGVDPRTFPRLRRPA